MKIKSKYFLLGLTATMLLTGCQSSSDKNAQTETKAPEAATEAPKANTEDTGTEAADTEAATEADTAVTEAEDTDTEADTAETEAEGTDTEADTNETEAEGADTEANTAETEAEGTDTTETKAETEDAAIDSDEAGETETGSSDGTDPEELTEESETEAPALAPITPSDYLIQDAADYVELGSYDGIEVVQYTYEITDDMVQNQIQEELQYAATEDETGKPSVDGDLVYFNLTSKLQSASESEEPEETFITLGEEEFGPEFDQKLTGVSTGEELDFSITFGDDIWMDEWVNQTVDFHVEVTGVTRMDVPEYDENYLTTYTDYDTKEDYEASIREYLDSYYTEESYYGALENLINACLDATTFNGYPESLLEECKEESRSIYSMFAGDDTTIEDVMELFGVTEEDIEQEALQSVNRRLFVSAYCLANDITVTEEEYVDYLTANADYYGADSAAAFEEEYTRSALVQDLYEAKATDLLYESAHITETPYTEEEFSGDDLEVVDDLDETEEISEKMTEDL